MQRGVGWGGTRGDLYNIWCKQALYESWKQMHTNLMPRLPPPLPPSFASYEAEKTYKAADGSQERRERERERTNGLCGTG